LHTRDNPLVHPNPTRVISLPGFRSLVFHFHPLARSRKRKRKRKKKRNPRSVIRHKVDNYRNSEGGVKKEEKREGEGEERDRREGSVRFDSTKTTSHLRVLPEKEKRKEVSESLQRRE